MPINTPPIMALNHAPWAKKLSLGFLGFFLITSLSPGSMPREIAGNESVIKFIHNICVGRRGTGQKKRIENRMVTSLNYMTIRNNDFLILL